MAAGPTDGDSESFSDRRPLLMEHMSSLSGQEHVVIDVNSGSSAVSVTPQGEVATAVDAQEGVPSTSRQATSRLPPSSASLRSSSFSRPADLRNYGRQQRASPLNSGLWISIELTITVSQIVASIIVLSLSRNENPRAPLFVWVVGYATGCLATLPLLYWRNTHMPFSRCT